MNKEVMISTGPGDTVERGKELAERLEPGAVVCLYGELGAGKTTFVKGLAKGLGIDSTVTSASYVLLREYENCTNLFHMDLFRLTSEEELMEAGLTDYLIEPEGIVAIEWPERIDPLLPRDRIDVRLNIIDETRREISINNRC